MGIFTAAVALFSKGGNGHVDREERSAASGPDAGSQSKATVLIIDDDPSFLDTMRSLLRDEGYNVLASSTGPKGLDMMRYAPRDIGVVLLDFNMPRFNGAETLQFLRKLSPDVKVLAVSGVSFNELPSEFREGVQRVVPKPFSNADLLKAINEVIQAKSSPKAPAPTAA
jgi:CheY-like chemotaxis protein